MMRKVTESWILIEEKNGEKVMSHNFVDPSFILCRNFCDSLLPPSSPNVFMTSQ